MILMYANIFAYILEKDGERAEGGKGEERDKDRDTRRLRDTETGREAHRDREYASMRKTL